MAEPIYVETNGCRHFHVDGFRCEDCGAELRWVVEKVVDYRAALDKLIAGDAYMASGFGMRVVVGAVDAALGRGGDQ